MSEPFFTESWKPILAGKYEVSCHGRFRKAGSKRFLKTSVHPGGYRSIGLCGKTRTVHSIVLEAFVGPRPKGAVINHLNGIKKDNRVENLIYCSQKENDGHARKTGLTPRATCRKLTHRQIKRIKALLSGAPILDREVGAIFGIHGSQVANIRRGKDWPDVV